MSLTRFVPTPQFDDYRELFKEHFNMEKRADGVLLVQMHTLGKDVKWSMELHRAIWQMWQTVGADPSVECVIYTATGDTWIAELDGPSWEPENRDPAHTRYEHMFYDGRRMLISMIHNVEVPTIGALNGPGAHTELGLMCDIAICSENTVIADPHFFYGALPGDGIHSCFFELMGVRRASYAMFMNQQIDAQKALEFGLVNEVVPRDQLIKRAFEIADVIMAQERPIRRMTSQIMRRQWKQRITDDLDMTFGTEMFGNFTHQFAHSDINLKSAFDPLEEKLLSKK